VIPNTREAIWLLVGVVAGMWIVPRVRMMYAARTNGGS
jgi:hypothetical protein